MHDGNSSGLIHLCLFIVGVGISIPSYGQQKVRVWEEPLILPAYVVKEPDKNPMFFTNQSYQGASRYIYPYALSDNITDEKIDKTYKALKKLGNKKEALGLAAEIESRGNSALTVTAEIDFFSKFGEAQSESVRHAEGNYLLALAHMIRGEEMQARERLESAIQLNPNHLWIKLHLNELKENVPYIR